MKCSKKWRHVAILFVGGRCSSFLLSRTTHLSQNADRPRCVVVKQKLTESLCNTFGSYYLSTSPTSAERFQSRCVSLFSTASSPRLICSFDQDEDFVQPTGSWPYTDLDLRRVDNSNDELFYKQPRFVTHIDERAIESLALYYKQEFGIIGRHKRSRHPSVTIEQPNSGSRCGVVIDVLDLCSSWISHLPTSRNQGDNNANSISEEITYGRVVGVGMNEEELKANPQLTNYAVIDLNGNNLSATFQGEYKDASFDAVCMAVSVDYLTNPLQVFQEIYRLLRPGGACIVSFSNRCFPTKAVGMWLRADDIGRLSIVGSYFHYAARWSSIEAFDIKLAPLPVPQRPTFAEMVKNPSTAFAWGAAAGAVARTNSGDPMYAVKAVK